HYPPLPSHYHLHHPTLTVPYTLSLHDALPILFSTTALWQGDQLIVHEPSQNVTGWKAELARQLKIDPANVRILSPFIGGAFGSRSEEHTSELQSRGHLVCRLLLEKKKMYDVVF